MFPEISEESNYPLPSPSKDPNHEFLRRGDLVRVSKLGIERSKRCKDRDGYLGRIVKCTPTDHSGSPSSCLYDVEWVLGGKLTGCVREELVYRTADEEGMTDTSQIRRCKRKPVDFMEDVARMEKSKKVITDQMPRNKLSAKKSPGKSKMNMMKRMKTSEKSNSSFKRKPSKNENTHSSTNPIDWEPVVENSPNSTSLDLYERHSREFLRFFTRLKDKVDVYRHFWDGTDDVADKYLEDCNENVEHYPFRSTNQKDAHFSEINSNELVDKGVNESIIQEACKFSSTHNEESHPPLTWNMIERWTKTNRYVLDRRKMEIENRRNLVEPFIFSNGVQADTDDNKQQSFFEKFIQQQSVFHPVGVNWALFRTDVFGMCEQGIARANPDDDDGQRGSLSYTVKRIKDEIEKSLERFSVRHSLEMSVADDRHYFAGAIESSHNKEAAMQSWKREPFPDRRYEKISCDVVCSGLSEIDEKIARFELRTNLPDSFIGQSYHYNNISLSEVWMKSVVEEAEANRENVRSKKKVRNQELPPMSKTDEVTRAQVNATMQFLLIAVQDRVMTETEVLKQRELESLNWFMSSDGKTTDETPQNEHFHPQSTPDRTQAGDRGPETIEKPVWGIDCYTRRNICICLELAFDADVALAFIEKWLLPAINACPESLAHNIGNAARILEELPFDYNNDSETHGDINKPLVGPTKEEWNCSVLAQALSQKIRNSSPRWLKAAANQLRRARDALGPNFFRVHPKGNGSVLLCPKLPANRLITFYHGELYPSWRWGEKMDAIEITQRRKDLKPALPDFYNMALERPQKDPRGYGLLFVDASRKAGHGSSLSHSCVPTCEVRVAAVNGELCLAMTTLRELECGEELTFDYNAVTESLDEYRSAVCLCGYGKCRGSFLHFATADCYQQILNRNCPITSRFASLVKGSMKKVLSEDDEKVLRCHGFLTAAFGAISVNRREVSSDGSGFVLVDSMDLVPVWLCTYIADALRYIEYERRALPIALMCGNRVSNDVQEKQPEKTPQRCLGAKAQQNWKEQAVAEYEKKMKELTNTSMHPFSSAEKKRKKSSHQIPYDVQLCSKISFQDADAEGISAMEQRIQQLAQSLSRVGRVLDRHREQSFMEQPLCNIEKHETIRNRVHKPLSVMSGEEVIRWIWNADEGVVHSLLNGVANSRCVRPVLLDRLLDAKQKYEFLDRFVCKQNGTNDEINPHEFSIESARSQLTVALLEMRQIMLDELSQMAAAFKKARASQSSSPPSSKSSVVLFEHSVQSDDALSNSQAAYISEDAFDPVTDKNEVTEDQTETSGPSDRESVDDRSSENNTQATQSVQQLDDWIKFYDERFSLQSSADLLLLYARTSNFFILNPYKDLESTPIEVYARELGNRVPISIIDHGLVSQHGDVVRSVLQSDTSNQMNKSDRACPSMKQTMSAPPDHGEPSFCFPDSIVSKVTVTYQGDYVVSQLLNWSNAGIGQKPGMPDLLGCGYLPPMCGCWSVPTTSRRKAERKTAYETSIRPKLIEWFQDQYERGNPWPPEIRNAFVSKEHDFAGSARPYGSPILDFLITGDETNIHEILSELNVGSKYLVKEICNSLPVSVDKGRPAQAVSTWVQCEACMKWRKIPWYVDPAELPEKFYCTDNKWNEKGNSCDTPEDDWDEADALVGADGKVEGSPILKQKQSQEEAALSSGDERNFTVGARFDVLRPGKSKFSVGTVVKVDFSGLQKRVQFRFGKFSSGCDEWIEFGDRIAPLYSKVPIPVSKALRPLPNSEDEKQDRNMLDERSFKIGAAFAVRRRDKDHFSKATVSQVNFSGNTKKIKFHFCRTSTCRDEWIDLGSDRIALLSCLESNTEKSMTRIGNINSMKTSKKVSAKRKSNPHKKASPVRSSQDEENVKPQSSSDKGCLSSKEGQQTVDNDVVPFDGNFDSYKVKPPKALEKSKQVCRIGSKHLEPVNKQAGSTINSYPGNKLSTEPERNTLNEKKCVESLLEILDEKAFTIGARFDVLRRGKDKICVGIVEDLDFTDSRKKVLFRFPKMKCNEWVNVGSSRIRAVNKASKDQKQAKAKSLLASIPDLSRVTDTSTCGESKSFIAPACGSSNSIVNFDNLEVSVSSRDDRDQINPEVQKSTILQKVASCENGTEFEYSKYASSFQQILTTTDLLKQQHSHFADVKGASALSSNMCEISPNTITSDNSGIREVGGPVSASQSNFIRQTGSRLDYGSLNMTQSCVPSLHNLNSETTFDKLLLLASMSDQEQSGLGSSPWVLPQCQTLNPPQVMVSQFDLAYGSQLQPFHHFQSAAFPLPEHSFINHSSYQRGGLPPNFGIPPFDRR